MRLIDADALLEGKQDHEMISTHLIWNAPTIEAEPVIHCHDCKHGEPLYKDDDFRRCTKNQQYGKVYPGDHYCGYAKRWGEDDV